MPIELEEIFKNEIPVDTSLDDAGFRIVVEDGQIKKIAKTNDTAGGVTVHSNLSGLNADDHPQYLTNTRGDFRYHTKSQVNEALAEKVPNTRKITINGEEKTLSSNISFTIPGGDPADGSITNAKLANLAVTNAKIANDTITEAKLAQAVKDKLNAIEPGEPGGGQIVYDAVVSTTVELEQALMVDSAKTILLKNGLYDLDEFDTPDLIVPTDTYFDWDAGAQVTGGTILFNGKGLRNPLSDIPLFYNYAPGEISFQGNGANYPHKISSEIVAFTDSTQNKSLAKRLDVLQAAFKWTASLQIPKDVTIECHSQVTLDASGNITEHLRKMDKAVHWLDKVHLKFGAGEFLIATNEWTRTLGDGTVLGNPAGTNMTPFYWVAADKGNRAFTGEKGTVFRIRDNPYNSGLAGTSGEANLAATYRNIHFKDFTIIDEGFVSDDAATCLFFGNCHHGSAENITFIGCMAFNLCVGTYGGAAYNYAHARDIRIKNCTFIDFANQPLSIVGGAKNIDFVNPTFMFDKGSKSFSFSAIMDFEPNHWGEDISDVRIFNPRFNLQNYYRRLEVTPDMIHLNGSGANANMIVFPTPHGIRKGQMLEYASTGTRIGTPVTDPQTTGTLTGTIQEDAIYALPVDDYRLKLVVLYRLSTDTDWLHAVKIKRNMAAETALTLTSAGTGTHVFTAMHIQAMKLQGSGGQVLRNIEVYNPVIIGLQANSDPNNTAFPSRLHTPIEIGGIAGGGIFGGRIEGSVSGGVSLSGCRDFQVSGMKFSDILGTTIVSNANIDCDFVGNRLKPGGTGGTGGKSVSISEIEQQMGAFSDATTDASNTGGGTIYASMGGTWKPSVHWLGQKLLFNNVIYNVKKVLPPTTVDGAFAYPIRVTPNPGVQGSGGSPLTAETRFSSNYYGNNPGAIVTLHADSNSVVESGIPTGGLTNQVLAKASDADYDLYFATLSSGGIKTIVAQVNMGGNSVAGWTNNAISGTEESLTGWIAEEAVDNTLTPDVPKAIYVSYVTDTTDKTVSATILGLDAGKSYKLEIFFIQPSGVGGNPPYNITVDGELVAEDYDPVAVAGGHNKGIAYVETGITGLTTLTFSVEQAAGFNPSVHGYRLTEE